MIFSEHSIGVMVTTSKHNWYGNELFGTILVFSLNANDRRHANNKDT